jgi:hypothetical protein
MTDFHHSSLFTLIDFVEAHTQIHQGKSGKSHTKPYICNISDSYYLLIFEESLNFKCHRQPTRWFGLRDTWSMVCHKLWDGNNAVHCLNIALTCKMRYLIRCDWMFIIDDLTPIAPQYSKFLASRICVCFLTTKCWRLDGTLRTSQLLYFQLIQY